MKTPVLASIASACATLAIAAGAQGVLEVPAPNSTHTGIGVVSGWHCTASRIEIVIDQGAPLAAGSHTERGDTAGVCGRTDTGFALLWNWNLLPTDCFGCRFHRVVALADGVPFAEVEIQVTSFGTEFMTGKSGDYLLPNFPNVGDATWLQWNEAMQNFTVYYTARNAASVSGTYYGAVELGVHAPYCGPWPPDRKLPLKYGEFVVQVADGRMAFSALYADGTTCRPPDVALPPYDPLLDRDGYVRAVFPPTAVAACPEFPGGLTVQANSLRLTASARDNCVSAVAWAAK